MVAVCVCMVWNLILIRPLGWIAKKTAIGYMECDICCLYFDIDYTANSLPVTNLSDKSN